jgi:hypothetical protein
MDKDFRSLEHKIRDLMMETMARNSAKRMQIANVGRPTDTDDKSKLAKQAEIKAKVIDEEAIDEAVEVVKKNYNWGKMITVHHGASHSYPLHPEHQAKIKKLKDNEKTSFKDETKTNVTAHRQGDTIHLSADSHGSTKTPVARHHFTEEVEIEEAAPKWDEKEFKLTRPGTWKHTSGSSIHYGNGSKSYRVMHGDESDPKKYSTLDGAQKAVRAKHVKEEVSDAAKKVLGDVAKQHGGKVPFKSTSYKDGKRVVTHGYNDEKGNRVVTKTTNEEVEEIDEISKDLATRYKDKVLNMPAAEQDKEKPRQKINRMIGAARAIGKIQKDPKRKVHATEEVIDEAQTKQQRAAKAALATQSGEYDAGKKGGAINRMALMKPKDLKKLAKEEVDPPVTTDKKKDKEKSDMDDMDAKMIKGGKTEVNLQPRTDDRPENASLEDSKSKKATKDENQKIGAKSGVKEETMSHTPFGLPQGLIDAVNEALKGGQKKLDKNHNGKLDGQDFKMLRGEKVKEEAVVEDEQIDEVSKDTLQHYIRRASTDAANHAYTAGKGAHGKMTINKDAYHAMADKRLRGISKAAQKLAKEEAQFSEEELARIEAIAKGLE